MSKAIDKLLIYMFILGSQSWLICVKSPSRCHKDDFAVVKIYNLLSMVVSHKNNIGALYINWFLVNHIEESSKC